MGDRKLRTQLIRLAYQQPELREDLLPLIREAEDKEAYLVETFDDPFVRTWPKLLKEIAPKLELVDFRTFMREEGNTIVEHPVRGIPVKVKSLKPETGGAELRDQLFHEWRKPRVEKNWKTVVSYISKNTGNKVNEVSRNLKNNMGQMMSGASGWTRDLVQDVWSSIAGAAPDRVRGYFPKNAGELTSERELRTGLIRLAHQNPDLRADILALFNDDD